MQTTGRGSSTACIDDGTGKATSFQGDFASFWKYVNMKMVGGKLVADVSGMGAIAAVRYAWAGDCCSEGPPTSKPCPVASCPLMSSSGLPANPFVAKIVGKKCACLAPQVCDD